jgi:2-keto-4-pentenoate hydratase
MSSASMPGYKVDAPTLTSEQIDRAADALIAATKDRRRIPELPDGCRPTGEPDAIAICEAVARRNVGTIAGWKVGAADPVARQKLGLSMPFTGAIGADAVDQDPATYRHADLLRPVVESEYAFRMARDLPPRDTPYTREEVEAAIGALHIGIEVPESRFADGHTLGALGTVSDSGAVGRYVLGKGYEDWRRFDLTGQDVVLRIDGAEAGRGTGASVMGHPVEALTWFANFLSGRGQTLKAGQFVSTGSCTGIIPVKPGASVVADFGPAGQVRAEFKA